MKVVLFCGGQGTRIRDYSERVPKPMVPIGPRPILWHLMKYYSHHGHNDFVLCLGYKAEVIKNFFLHYEEAESNDFVLAKGGRELKLLNKDIEDWTITFVDTGANANIGERLTAVRRYLDGEEIFLANYSDGLTDLDLGKQISTFAQQPKAVGCFLAVKPPQSYYTVSIGSDGAVTGIEPMTESDSWINGGFFVFRNEIFDYIRPGEELALEPFRRLIEQNKLMAYRYTGFWAPMDTFKEKQWLDDLYASGAAPWQLWKRR